MQYKFLSFSKLHLARGTQSSSAEPP